MEASLRTAKLFRISRALFRKEDGSPVAFHSDYVSDDLQHIIHAGGGKLTNNPTEAAVLLCERQDDKRVRSGHLPIHFVVDCVKRNSFLDVDKYREEILHQLPSTSRVESDSDSGPDHEKGFSRSSFMRVKATDLFGRKKYTDAEDFRIIKYLINHDKYEETGGNVVWKQMESLKITDHTHQSMKARFQKKIIPDIDSYNIPAEWKAKLTGLDISKFHKDSSALDETAALDETLDSQDLGSDGSPASSPTTRSKMFANAHLQSPVTSAKRWQVNTCSNEADLEASLANSKDDHSHKFNGQEKNDVPQSPCPGTIQKDDKTSSERIVDSNDEDLDDVDKLILSEAKKNEYCNDIDKASECSENVLTREMRKRRRDNVISTSDEGSPAKSRTGRLENKRTDLDNTRQHSVRGTNSDKDRRVVHIDRLPVLKLSEKDNSQLVFEASKEQELGERIYEGQSTTSSPYKKGKRSRNRHGTDEESLAKGAQIKSPSSDQRKGLSPRTTKSVNKLLTLIEKGPSSALPSNHIALKSKRHQGDSPGKCKLTPRKTNRSRVTPLDSDGSSSSSETEFVSDEKSKKRSLRYKRGDLSRTEIELRKRRQPEVTSSSDDEDEELAVRPHQGDGSLQYVGKKETKERVQVLCEEYGLAERDVALLLAVHDGNFHSVIRYMES